MEHLEMEYDVYKGKVEDELIQMGRSKLVSHPDFDDYMNGLYWDGFSVFEAAVDVVFFFEE